MRIAIDARMYGAKATTGIGVYIQELVTHIVPLLPNTHTLTLIVRPENAQEIAQRHPEVEIVEAAISWYGWKEQLVLPSILRKHKFDLVHFPHFNVPFLYRKPYVVTIHDLTPKDFPGPRVRSSVVRKKAYEFVLRQAIVRARHVITTSEHVKKQITHFFPVDKKEINVLPLAINKRYLPVGENEQEQIKKELGITKSFILYVGVWRDHKNIPRLVQAFDVVREKLRIDCQLVLTGKSDPNYPEIQNEIERSAFRTDIILPGFVDENKLPALYSAATVFAFVSLAEGFGLVALEALACGTPVVASQTTSVPEVLGDVGVYVDPLSVDDIALALSEIFKDSSANDSFEMQRQKILRKYSWETLAKQTFAVYLQ